ncbi:hypothetical protein F2Q69_00044237 [Brassica cretica]|uniref:Uncharacterized protein n=1 Tax=Brassica cretica TaxID=69181 RepID=A0A8S9N529_BRACR|nr:hypothetical protein F2Q69_00044237 [Brassica cretica]
MYRRSPRRRNQRPGKSSRRRHRRCGRRQEDEDEDEEEEEELQGPEAGPSSISSRAKRWGIMNSFINDIFEKLAGEA